MKPRRKILMTILGIEPGNFESKETNALPLDY
jgi:hypothetical protein